MNTIWGINVGTHDSSISVFSKSGTELDLVFAAHGERSSRIKNDKLLSHDIFQQAIAHNGARLPSEVVYYERDLIKRTRQLWARQWKTALRKPSVSSYLPEYIRDGIHLPMFGSRESSTEHHKSHAACPTRNFAWLWPRDLCSKRVAYSPDRHGQRGHHN